MTISRTIREQVTGQLRDQVMAGSLVPGAVLRETELAKRFGVSRGPIRDALLQLSSEGYLAYQANRGVTVREPPDQMDREFIADLRRRIEVHVVTKGIGGLSDEAIAEISQVLDGLQQACSAGDLAGVRRFDYAFHEAILSACNGMSLLPAWKQLCSRMRLAYDRLPDLKLVHREHQKILDGLKARDLSTVTEALVENII